MEGQKSPEKANFSKIFWEYKVGVTINRFTDQLGMFSDNCFNLIEELKIIPKLVAQKRDPILKALKELEPSAESPES